MQRQNSNLSNTSAPRQSPRGDRICQVAGCRKKHCYDTVDNVRIYSKYCYRHTCAKIVPVEDGYHCPMPKKECEEFCENHMTCAATGCSETGTYPGDGSIPWYCTHHRCTSDGCLDGAYDLLERRCQKHQECKALQCSAPPDRDAHSSFCKTHTCNHGTCYLQAVANNRCGEHSKCGSPSCDRPCAARADGRTLEPLCDAHLQLKCAKPGCGGRKLHSHRRYCLEHGCRLPNCANERHEHGGTLCDVHKCTFDACFDSIARPDDPHSLFCAVHACRQPGCLYSLKRPSSFCDSHTCRREGCLKPAASGPGSSCAAHADNRCRVEGCRFAAEGEDPYCKARHGCVEKGCRKARLSLRLGADGDEDDLMRCLQHDREAQRAEWKDKYDRLLGDFEALKLGKVDSQRKRRHATVEDDTDEDDGH